VSMVSMRMIRMLTLTVHTGMIKMMMRRGWTMDNYWAEEPGGGTVANNLITTCCWRAFFTLFHRASPALIVGNKYCTITSKAQSTTISAWQENPCGSKIGVMRFTMKGTSG